MLNARALLDGFADPPASYRPQPFWFINHELDPDEIALQVRMMHEKGVGGFIYHARHGLGDAFMSPEWLEALRRACEQAEALGMDAWLYDEDNWPSGTVGGRLTKAHPEFRMRYLRYWEERVSGPCRLDVTPEMDDNTMLQVVRAPLLAGHDGMVPDLSATVEITEQYDAASGTLSADIPPGEHLVGFFAVCPVPEGVTFRNGWYLDTMDEEACQAFVRACYDPNLEAVRPYLGTTVKGIFTDEPGLMIHDGAFGVQAFRPTLDDPFGRLPGYVLAWSRHFSEMFRAWRGYDLLPHLLTLVYETGPEDVRIRQDYFQTATEAYIKHYYGAIRAWCEKQGIALIGHTLEEPIRLQARSQGNQHLVLSQYDIPGYDYLAMQAGIATEERPARLLAGQCAYSIAALKGGERIMVEAFGGSGNRATLADRRRHANMMALMGTSLFVPHGFYQSFVGERKADWPPSEFYQAAFWDHYDYFADYLGRLSLLAHGGAPVDPIMILSPIHSAYRQLGQDGAIQTHIAVDDTFSRLSYDLLTLQRSHIYLDEAHLAEAAVRDDGLWINDYLGSLPILIVPDATVLCPETVAQLQAFAEAGGRILWLGQIPTLTTDGQPIAADALQGANPTVLPQYERDQVAAFLEDWLPQALHLDTADDAAVMATWKRFGAERLLLAFNPSEWDALQAEIALPDGDWRVEELDPETGERRPFAGCAFELTPSQLRAFWLTPGLPATDAQAPEMLGAWHSEQAVGFERLADNLLPLDSWQMRLVVPPEEWAGGIHCAARNTVTRYRTTFQVEQVPDRLLLLTDDLPQTIPPHYGVLSGYRNLEIQVNGVELPPLQPVTYPDHYLTGVEIASHLREGENEITLYICQSNERPEAPNLSQPMMLCGDFALGEGDALIAPPAEPPSFWQDQGAPYYSGVGCYRYEIRLDAPREVLRLDLGEVRESARILVNGEIAATRGWAPYVIDVPADWRQGGNEVIVQVANTAANLWEKRPLPSGMDGVLKWAEVG